MNDLEKTLIDEIKSDNVKSFELVFKGYYPRLCKYAFSLVKDYDKASDLVKDTFVKWWDNRKNIQINTSVSAYLFRSVHNHALNYINRERSKNRLTSESDLPMSIEELTFPVSSDYPIDKLLTDELEHVLEKAISNLPDQCREIFILSRIEQLSHNEIAEKLGISPNTVKVQIYKALLKLKVDLKDYLPFLAIAFFRQV